VRDLDWHVVVLVKFFVPYVQVHDDVLLHDEVRFHDVLLPVFSIPFVLILPQTKVVLNLIVLILFQIQFVPFLFDVVFLRLDDAALLHVAPQYDDDLLPDAFSRLHHVVAFLPVVVVFPRLDVFFSSKICLRFSFSS